MPGAGYEKGDAKSPYGAEFNSCEAVALERCII